MNWTGPDGLPFIGDVLHNCEPDLMHRASILAVDPGVRCGWAARHADTITVGECSGREIVDHVVFTTGEVVVERAVDRFKRTFDPWPHYVVGALTLCAARDRVVLFSPDKTKVGRKWFGVPRGSGCSTHELDALAILFHHLTMRGSI